MLIKIDQIFPKPIFGTNVFENEFPENCFFSKNRLAENLANILNFKLVMHSTMVASCGVMKGCAL